MNNDIAIKVEHVSKIFKLPHEKQSSIKGSLVNLLRGGDRSYEKLNALKDISFEIKKGEFFGIVGRNGSGKSTLLKLLAGIYAPTQGNVGVVGKLTPFIELGVGFNPELTGRENVFLNGALLGFSRKDMKAMYADIVNFAELHRFMDQKLKNYSSGMHVRLAFSIAIRVRSDILLIDEVLAVGDAAFQTKCFDYFAELKKKNTTVIFVSHDRGALERFCEKGILINEGKLISKGTIREVLHKYSTIVLNELRNAGEREEISKSNRKKITSSYVSISNIKTLNGKETEKKEFTYGEDISVEYTINFKTQIVNPIFGVTIWVKNVDDNAIFAVNTLTQGIAETGTFKDGEMVKFSVKLPQLLNDGEYYVEPAVANESATIFYEQLPRAATFYISGSNNPHSLITSRERIKLVN